ncbi:MAG: hypothetical protein JKY46_00170 [Robiginitomaculum sp.]|nr:hypothetical protein [Robiginitomaculum sp.]
MLKLVTVNWITGLNRVMTTKYNEKLHTLFQQMLLVNTPKVFLLPQSTRR